MVENNVSGVDRTQAQSMREEIADKANQTMQDITAALYTEQMGGSYSQHAYKDIGGGTDVTFNNDTGVYMDKNGKEAKDVRTVGADGKIKNADGTTTDLSGLEAYDNGVKGDGKIYLHGKAYDVNQTSFTMALANESFIQQNMVKATTETQKSEKELKMGAQSSLN